MSIQALLPTFVCIGAQKAATTWLYGQLRQHPEVFLPRVKELNYFYRDLPLERYQDHYRSATPRHARGDISPNYMVLPGVAERMRHTVPAARLICILREPVARAKSQYRMAVGLGNIPSDVPFIAAFRDNLQYIRERGCYLELLERFTQLYCTEQVLILLYDDLLEDTPSFLREVHRHIGVQEGFLASDHQVRIEPGEGLELAPEQEAEVRSFYAAKLDELEHYLGRSLPAWRVIRP